MKFFLSMGTTSVRSAIPTRLSLQTFSRRALETSCLLCWTRWASYTDVQSRQKSAGCAIPRGWLLAFNSGALSEAEKARFQASTRIREWDAQCYAAELERITCIYQHCGLCHAPSPRGPLA